MVHYGSADSESTRWMLADQDRAHLRPTEWESWEPVVVAVVVGKWSERCSVVSDFSWPWNLQARILEWDAIPFSRGSSQTRGWTQVSHIVGRFFTNWATREAYGGGESMFLIYSAANFLRPHIFKWEDSYKTSIIIILL